MIPAKFSNQNLSLLDRLFNTDLMSPDFTEPNTTMPSVNIKENDDRFEVEMAAPGLEKEDFNIELNNDELRISSEKKFENEEKDGDKFTRKEFSYQSFKRTFTLPTTADGEKISANYVNGVLRVSIPKKEEAKPKPPKQIAIK